MLTIGRPVVKSAAKDSSKAASAGAAAGARTRGIPSPGGMPIIGRPVLLSQNATPSKLSKAQGIADSPQTSSQVPGQGQTAVGHQGSLSTQGQQQGQQSLIHHMGQAGRMAAAGAPSPGQPLMQVGLTALTAFPAFPAFPSFPSLTSPTGYSYGVRMVPASSSL